jgi:2-methylcitrate dehydratase PrpD
VPAVLAWAEARGLTGKAMLEALILGYEIAARVGIASKLNTSMHPHGTWGTIGAALAIARLEGASAGQVTQAVNIASSLGIATSRRTMLEGATVRNSYAGLSNQLGLMAWSMTMAGFTGEADGVATVYDHVIASDFDAAVMLDGLGDRWEIARNYFKMHAACRYTHASLDALGEILAREPVDPAGIVAIEVRTYSWAAQLDNKVPDNMLAAKFSIPFALATTAINGSSGVPSFRGDNLSDAAIFALADRVSVVEDDAMTAALPASRPARVTVTLADGRSLSAEATVNKGDVESPYTVDAILGKFRTLTEPVWGAEHGERIVAAVMALDQAQDCGDLFDLLRAEPLAMAVA